MAAHDFTQRASELASTLAQLFAYQGTKLEAELLRVAIPELEVTDYDNWNGGTTTYAFVLRIPVELFARVGDDAEQKRVEKRIYDNLNRLLRNETHDHVGEVVVMPDASLTVGHDPEPSANDEAHATWQPEHFRLFISHPSSIKAQAHSLKAALVGHCVAGFVAHDDIQPARDWQNVIEGALRTMDALVALVTPDFISSKWCDQEVGIAIGRNKPVLPVRIGADPYGFMGRYQGIAGKGLTPGTVAASLFQTLSRDERTSRRLVEIVLKRFAQARSFREAKQLIGTLEMFDHIPLELLRAVEPALDANVDLREAHNVPDRFRRLLVRPNAS